MASAIIRGAVNAGLETPAAYLLCDADPARLEAARDAPFAARIAGTFDSISEAAGRLGPSDQILLAVKPQALASVAGDLKPLLDAGPRRVVISILAGIPITRLRDELGPQAAPVRVMPNLPISVGAGMSAIATPPDDAGADDALAGGLFESSGEVVRLEESLMDAFTGLAGSGPAYLFYLAEGMIRGAIEAGFEEAEASRIVRQTLLGSAMMLKDAEQTAAALRAAVTSKGGTTAAGIAELDRAGALEAITRAVTAARDRGRELGAG